MDQEKEGKTKDLRHAGVPVVPLDEMACAKDARRVLAGQVEQAVALRASAEDHRVEEGAQPRDLCARATDTHAQREEREREG